MKPKEKKFSYFENNNLQMLYLPYKGGTVGMYLILPSKNIPISQFLNEHMQAENFGSWKS